MIFVDTGFLLAAADQRDALHDRAAAWARVIKEPLLTSEYVLWEFVNGLSRPQERPKAHAMIARLYAKSDFEILPASSPLFEADLAFHAARPDKEWSLTDCISFLIMKDRQVTQALTHDRHFEQAGFEALLRREPA
jgi:uncharacterized protein